MVVAIKTSVSRATAQTASVRRSFLTCKRSHYILTHSMTSWDPSRPRHSGPDDSYHGRIGADSEFPVEQGRYHLYIGLFCPFAHRANLVRSLYGYEDLLPLSVVKPYPKGDSKGWPGWRFNPAGTDGTAEPGQLAYSEGEPYPNATEDHLFKSDFMHKVYFKDDIDYKGRYPVPVIWDKKANKMVSNESAEMLRWLPGAFDTISPQRGDGGLDLYPEDLKDEIDEVNEWMQRDLNTGVYKAGFALDQETYNKNVPVVFAALNHLEKLIYKNGGPYVFGKRLTEVDLRAYATIIRFDPVYVQHFKCNLGTIRHDYPVINNWLKNLYWSVKGFKETTDFAHIKDNYTKSHHDINPKAITPMGPFPDIEEGVEPDFSKLVPGEIKFPASLEYEARL